MSDERRRAQRTRPPEGQRIEVRWLPEKGPALSAHLWDLSELGLGGLFTRDAARELRSGSRGRLHFACLGPEGTPLCFDLPATLRQARPMAAGFFVGLEFRWKEAPGGAPPAALSALLQRWQLARGADRVA
jgi:hypothetical protein